MMEAKRAIYSRLGATIPHMTSCVSIRQMLSSRLSAALLRARIKKVQCLVGPLESTTPAQQSATSFLMNQPALASNWMLSNHVCKYWIFTGINCWCMDMVRGSGRHAEATVATNERDEHSRMTALAQMLYKLGHDSGLLFQGTHSY